ncbi:MAG: hypothetical protein EBX52_09530 [Proteobacteria bacterium]|nr:hypothetical protein [Pseudomonadota bacterium]
MTFMHFFPEFLIVILLFVSLMMMGLRVLSHGTLALWVSIVSAVGLLFFASRTDLATFESASAMLRSDSLACFGRLLSLLMVSLFSLGAWFHPGMNVREKQGSTVFILLSAFFSCGLFLSQSLVLFFGAAIGIHFCVSSLILIESKSANHWLKVLRSRAVIIGMSWCLGFLFFVVSSFLFKGPFFSSWPDALAGSGTGWELEIFLVLLVLVGSLPLIHLRKSGQAPYALGIAAFGSLLVLQVFWFRMGVPFLAGSQLLPKPAARILLALLFGGITLKSVVAAIRSRDHDSWVSSVYPVLAGICLFTLLLPSDQSLAAFEKISLSLVLMIPLISRVFLDREYRVKGFSVIGLFTVIGAPPLVHGEQIYRMIKDLIDSRDFIPAALVGVIWFGLTLAAIQFIGKLLLVRTSKERRKMPDAGDWVFLGIYVVGIVALTAFQGSLQALLNDHPVLNLW